MKHSEINFTAAREPKTLMSLNQEGKFVETNSAMGLPYGKPPEWAQFLRNYTDNPNHSAIYGDHLGFVAGPEPYFYDPANPEVQQPVPGSLSKRQFALYFQTIAEPFKL